MRQRAILGAAVVLASLMSVPAFVCPAFGAIDYAMRIGPGYARVPNAPELNPGVITVEAWVSLPANAGVSGNDPVVDKGFTSHSSPFYQYHIGVSALTYVNGPGTSGFTAAVNGQSAGAGTATPYVANEWFHVAGTFDGTAVKYYVNGVLKQSNPAAGTLSAYNTDLFIGRFGNLNLGLTGLVDEVRIWNVVRTAAEIQGTMNRTLVGNEPGLVAYYDFNTPSATALADVTGGNDGVLTGVTVGSFVPTGAALPEPGAVGVLGAAGVGLVRRRR